MTRQMFAAGIALFLVATTLSGTATAADAILIEFTASHCPPCQAMKPTLAQLERTGVAIRHVDVAAEPELASRYGIRKTPTFVVLSGGREVTRLVGTQSLAQLQAALAVDPSGPLIPTGASARSVDSVGVPQTRLAPLGRTLAGDPRPQQTFTSAAAPASPPSQSEAMPSMSLADAVQRAQAATVRLRVHDGHGYGAGTGTIIDKHGDEALVLTCGHLFRETKGEGKIEVDLFVGGEVRTVLGQVVDFDADSRDIALVVIRPGFPVQSVSLLGADEAVRNGQTAFSFGCDRGDDPSRRDTRITGINKYNQHLGVSNLEIAGAPIDGRSGGGLFDDTGRLIGVCNAADYKNDVGIYAGPGTVQWQLDRVGLSQLYKTPASPEMTPGEPPQERIASLPGSNDLAVGMSQAPVSSVGLPTAAVMESTAADFADQEVIVIVRDRSNPTATSRVMTLNHPTADLLQMLEKHSR